MVKSLQLLLLVPTVRSLLQDANEGHPFESLAFVHVPYNFGHTVEKYALAGPGKEATPHFLSALGGSNFLSGDAEYRVTWEKLKAFKKYGGVAWGHVHPELQATSEKTGCPMYFTPQKYWPRDLAVRYFGKKRRFGILRNPYERLVAMFRGNFENYGATPASEGYHQRCDVDGGVRLAVEQYLNSTNPFVSQCTMLPQSLYWEGEFGIDTSVDNYLFPHSINEVFVEHGVYDRNITNKEIFHVGSCPRVGVNDLSPETKRLIRKAYAKDFELICKLFGRCDFEANLCLPYVNGMCPEDDYMWDAWHQMYKARPKLVDLKRAWQSFFR